MGCHAPAFLRTGGQVQDAEPVLVADAGGTNLRRALVCFRNGQPVVTEHDSIPMPGSREEIGWDEFLTATAAFLLPLAGGAALLPSAFPTPLTVCRIWTDAFGLQQGGPRARLRRPIVGAELLSRLRALGGGDGYHFLLLNDATASAMGGLALTGERERLAGWFLHRLQYLLSLEGREIRKLPAPPICWSTLKPVPSTARNAARRTGFWTKIRRSPAIIFWKRCSPAPTTANSSP